MTKIVIQEEACRYQRDMFGGKTTHFIMVNVSVSMYRSKTFNSSSPVVFPCGKVIVMEKSNRLHSGKV